MFTRRTNTKYYLPMPNSNERMNFKLWEGKWLVENIVCRPWDAQVVKGWGQFVEILGSTPNKDKKFSIKNKTVFARGRVVVYQYIDPGFFLCEAHSLLTKS